MAETTQRQVQAVFVNYKRKITGPDNKTAVGLGMKSRGDLIDTSELADGELDRLERFGALVPVGREVAGGEVEARLVQAALDRALNPTDVMTEDFGAPISVSPPPMGARPRGDLLTGDTGIDPADQPPPPVTGTVTLGQGTAEEQAALDELRRQPNAPRTDAPDVEDTAALSEFIRSGNNGRPLNASDTVALAEGDPDRARYVLEAEKAASGQDPRASVEKPLQKIIEGD